MDPHFITESVAQAGETPKSRFMLVRLICEKVLEICGKSLLSEFPTTNERQESKLTRQNLARNKNLAAQEILEQIHALLRRENIECQSFI